MTSFSGRPADRGHGSSAWMRRIQHAWLGMIFVLGLGYIVLVPPFQSVDEVAHWDRAWTVARGQFNCKMLPYAAAQFVNFGFRFDNEAHRGPIPWSFLRDAYEFSGGPGEFSIATAGCGYPPIGYVPAALAAALLTREPSEPGPHKMFIAFYGARLANWLFFFACLVAAYRLSVFPLPVLVFASIPMVIHQSMSLNNDSVLFSGTLLCAALMTRLPTRASLWSAIAIVTLLSAIKPVNAILATLIWIGLYRALRERAWRRIELAGMAVASLALPLLAFQGWQLFMHLPVLGLSTGTPVPNVNEELQLSLLRQDPTRVLSVLKWQLEEVFTAPPINGGWRGLFLALGWYRYVAPDRVYHLARIALALGCVVLGLGARVAVPSRPPLVLVLLSVGSIVAYAVAVTLILYLAFTPVGAEVVFGVQGRYFLVPLAMLLFLLPLARLVPARLPTPAALALIGAAACFGGAANIDALLAIRALFWAA